MLADLDQAVLALPLLGLMVIASWRDHPPAGPGRRAGIAAALATYPALALIGAGCLALGVLRAAGAASAAADRRSLLTYGAVLGITGVAILWVVGEKGRERLARWMPIRPGSAVHATALVLTMALVGLQLATQVSQDVLAQEADRGTPLSPADLIVQQLPLLAAAGLGVGFGLRRRPSEALRRLGLVVPAWWQVSLALAAAGLFYVVGTSADHLSQWLTPDLAHKVDAANQRLFGRLGNPLGIATIAVVAGVCEETLFRGALQPRLGILWTSLVFTAVHTQYGLSIDALAVLLLAVMLGFLRRLANTSTTIVCHVAYNALVGAGIAAAWMGPAVAIEILLLGATLAKPLMRMLGVPRRQD